MADQQILAVLRSSRASMRCRTRLDGTLYAFRFMYNVRIQLWMVDIRESDDTPLVLSAPIVTGTNILGAFADSRLPPGQLFARDTLNQGVAPTRHDLRGRTQFIYRPEADLAAHVGESTEIF
jgi:hypothetical protein